MEYNKTYQTAKLNDVKLTFNYLRIWKTDYRKLLKFTTRISRCWNQVAQIK